MEIPAIHVALCHLNDTSRLRTMRAALDTKIPHRWAKQISRSGKYQTVRVLLVLVVALSQKIGPNVVFGSEMIQTSLN